MIECNMCGDLVHEVIGGVCNTCFVNEIQEPVELGYSETL